MSGPIATARPAFRLPHGGRVDRGDVLSFNFDGRLYEGLRGDTLASALIANGVHLVGRSFKYHRPRGILAAGWEEPNAMVELGNGPRRTPNSLATVTELYDGLRARSQNRWPSLRFDLQSLNSLASPFFAAGFYYKTFMWPKSFWEKLYEPLIRRSAGLGRAAPDPDPDPDHYEKGYLHCDVLVIGAGPAGIMAALAAARAGARVILAEQDFELGGRLLSELTVLDGAPASDWIRAKHAELDGLGVRIMRRTTIFGVYDQGTYGAVERVADHRSVRPAYQPRQRGWRIYAKRAVLASGALPRPIAFGDNDRPGVMLGQAVRSYVNRFAAAPGKSAVIVTSDDDGWLTARDLAAAGIEVKAIVDSRQEPPQHVEEGWDVTFGGCVQRAIGRHRVEAVEIRDAAGRISEVECDFVSVSNGLNPVVHLTCHLGGKPVWDEGLHAFVPGTTPPGMTVAGAAAGRVGLAAALTNGASLGGAAAADLGFRKADVPEPEIDPEWMIETPPATPVWQVKGGRGKAFVDFQNDVTVKDIELAHREGYRSVEHLKRYTTLGMATDQGKTANVTGLAVMADLRGEPIPQVGTTVFRPPFTPVALGPLVGHHRGKEFRPSRLTPSHHWAAGQGAVFTEVGLWLRARWYPKPGESDWQTTVTREVNTVRAAAGVCDVSTFGKIDIQGPDAAAFLDRLYVNTISKTPVGKARYGLMLREDGIVLDDGTVARLAENHFVATCTTANAAKVMQHVEFCRQVLWPELDVQIAAVSDHWAQFSVAGPKSREVLQALVGGAVDPSNEALPFMGVASFKLGNVPARIFRVTFSGERAYEIAVPAPYGGALIRTLMTVGEPFGLAPYGIEALGVMRIEKGHAGGPEINGRTTAGDLGFGKMLAAAKKDFVGRVMAGRPDLMREDRRVLIGVKPLDPTQRIAPGSHFIEVNAPADAAHDEGYVTSLAWSPSLGHDIALGLLARGRERIGETIRAVDLLQNHDVECEITSGVFVDPEGGRPRD